MLNILYYTVQIFDTLSNGMTKFFKICTTPCIQSPLLSHYDDDTYIIFYKLILLNFGNSQSHKIVLSYPI